MRSVTALSTAFLMIVSSMAGCIEGLEDLTEIIGCSDENAENFNPDATTGSDDLCLFLENEARFMAAMGDAMAADPSSYLLDSDSGVSGVEYSMSMSGYDPNSGMSVSMEMLSVIMVDLESQSMYNRSMISYMDMISIDSEMVWSGTDIMVTTSIGGPMASEVGGSGTTSSISRDMSPDLEEAVRAASFGMTGMMGMEDLLMSGMLPGGDHDDDEDDHSDDEEPDWEYFDPYCYDQDADEIVDIENSEDSGLYDEQICYEMGHEWVYSQEKEDELHEEDDFEWMDQNGDGFVEMGEIEAAVRGEPSIPVEMIDCIIDNVDPVFYDYDNDDNEMLDEDEFSDFDNYLENNFDIDEMCGLDSQLTEDMMPEGSSVSITQDESGIQTMVMQTVDDTGDMTMWIRLHEDGSFHSYEMEMDDGESVMSMTFSYLTSEMVSIPEIDYTLDRTATPIFVEVEAMMVCDNGDLVDVLSVMDGWWDCDDGSDESFVDDRDEHYYEAHWDFCEWDEYVGEEGYMEEEYLCWMEDLDDLSVTQIEELQDCEQSENGCETEVYCEEISYGSWECAYYVIDINEDEEDGLDWWNYHWESYFDGHCEWEGNPDDDENRWSCMEDINHSDWDTWWYYCENHDEDWFCTDDYGQDPDHEHSADNVNYNESNASEEDPSWVDGTSWELYPGGHCEWEGNPDDEEDSWSCKRAEWDNWWYYCENHDEDWFCTDGPGQDPDHEHSADNDNYYATDHDDEEICIWEDEDGVVHYDCEEGSEDYDFPMVMHAHVVGQVLNAPIADFELRVLDCAVDDMGVEDDMDDDSEPVWDDCTVVMAFPLSGGEIDGVVVDYVDSDGDGMISSGDISIVSGPVGEYEIQPYDTWAEEYSADSALIGQELPGFGAFLGVIGLLGAALAGRERDA